jgi:decaprenyl-phosphate phosphoribosyltransferase
MLRTIPTDQADSFDPPGTAPDGGRLPGSLIRIARPKQWVKNLLVFAAPGAAGVLTHPHPLMLALGAFGIFCLAASGTYCLNDAVDAEADRHHPLKGLRPVAAGAVSAPWAISAGAALMASSIGLAWWMSGYRLALVTAVYVAVSCTYSVRLKHEPVLDLACLSSGFILRAIAGGVATGVPLSHWFVIVASFGSLFLATGKRSAEYLNLGDTRAVHRPVLGEYPLAFLRSVRLLAASVTIAGYCLWAFERSAGTGIGHGPHHPIWHELSIIPVVLAVLYLELGFARGRGGVPEELALHDRTLQALGIVWVMLFAVGVYA